MQIDAGAPDLRLVTHQPDTLGPNLVTAQVGRPTGNFGTAQVEALTELSETQWKIVEYCDVPRRLTEIMADLTVTERKHFKQHYLNPLIRAGIVAMTNPGKPRASNQRYVITDVGERLKTHRMDRG